MRAYPDRENTMTLLTEWARHHAAVEKLMDGITETIGLDPNGPMFDTVWRLFDAYTGTLAVEVGDFCGWLEWYRDECEMGKRGLTITTNGKAKRIKTLANLCTVILDERKRKPE